MTRINAIRNIASSVSWGKNIAGDINAYVFAAVLIICAVTVGCSSDKPKPVTSSTQIPAVQPQAPTPVSTPVATTQGDTKPAAKKPVVRKRPATVNYADKTSGVTFEYPRRYAIETGDAASLLVASNPIPMNFVQPGGVALAAVELPETNYVNTDFSSAYFNVSINKTLSADQCNEFSVPQMKSTAKSETPSTEVALTCHPEDGAVCGTKDPMPATASTGPEGNSSPDAKAKSSDLATKLMIGDMELRATEAVSGEGTRQSDSKYFHIYQNGACYEFALNVTTNASEEGLVKHVDRDRVFTRLEQILSTVKINPVVVPEVATEGPTPVTQESPAQ